MGDIQNIHDLQLTYGSCTTNGRRTEHPCTGHISTMEDGQNTKNQQSTDQNYLSAIGINIPTPSRKT